MTPVREAHARATAAVRNATGALAAVRRADLWKLLDWANGAHNAMHDAFVSLPVGPSPVLKQTLGELIGWGPKVGEAYTAPPRTTVGERKPDWTSAPMDINAHRRACGAEDLPDVAAKRHAELMEVLTAIKIAVTPAPKACRTCDGHGRITVYAGVKFPVARDCPTCVPKAPTCPDCADTGRTVVVERATGVTVYEGPCSCTAGRKLGERQKAPSHAQAFGNDVATMLRDLADKFADGRVVFRAGELTHGKSLKVDFDTVRP